MFCLLLWFDRIKPHYILIFNDDLLHFMICGIPIMHFAQPINTIKMLN